LTSRVHFTVPICYWQQGKQYKEHYGGFTIAVENQPAVWNCTTVADVYVLSIAADAASSPPFFTCYCMLASRYGALPHVSTLRVAINHLYVLLVLQGSLWPQP
jgi:hypothetical protein